MSAPAGTTVAEFSITDPLPTGTTLLEASAGTGKTWAIAALVTRFVAEGRAELDDLLVVTFGRAASAELKDRVRERLVEADATLTRGSAPGGDPLLDLLLDADEAERAERRRRLRHAVARFDEATITTTHGFCHAVLRSLGTTGDVEPGSALIEDDTEIVDQVVADLYLRAVGMGQTPPFSAETAAKLGRRAVEDPSAHLLPTDAPQGSEPDLRRRFAAAVRDESARRRLAARTLSYDDLLQRLAEALEPADSPAGTVMRDRWKVVLVDEFQDTDPVQWRILERAFLGHATMVLVGDPKQAIYGFRGGDVDTYLRAAGQADDRRTLTVNHRSDAPLVAAVDTVLRGAALGDPAIVVRPATAALQGSRLHDPGHDAPFRLRAHLRQDAGAPLDEPLKTPAVRPRIAADVAADIAALLGRGATYDHGAGPVPLTAGDVAVLVERHADAESVHEQLALLGVPAVRSGGPDVLNSEAGREWLTLLTALESPHRSGVVRAAALGPFLGHTAAELAVDHAEGGGITDTVSSRLRDLADLQRERGTAGMVEALTGDPAVVDRLLRHEGGRRLLTDLEHVGHVLAGATRRHGLGLSGLRRWLLDRRSENAASADRTRRLDTDAEAVQIVTTFVSKGLQYPVVYVPFLFDRWVPKPSMVRLHDADGRRCLDVGDGGPSWRKHARASDRERAEEALRLLYVAMTRAQSRLVMHWAPTTNAHHAALHRMLFRPDPRDPTVPERQPVPTDVDAITRLRDWTTKGGPVLEQMLTRAVPLEPAPSDASDLALRRLDRTVDTTWTRTSYTSLVRRDDGASVASEPETVGPDDEVEVVAEQASDADPFGPSPWAELVGGAALGTLVHGVLEDVDPDEINRGTRELEVEVRRRVGEQLVRRPIGVDVDVLVPALSGALRTPLGPLADDLTLAETLGRRPFREMDFELPLAGGSAGLSAGLEAGGARRAGHLGDVADLMEAHLPVDDPLRPFAAELRDATLRGRTLRGYLTGSIDLLLRLDGDRSLVVDHKTNRLEGPDLVAAGGGLSAYAPERLADAMLHTTYPLQALLYAVAQHRFLRWRLRGYDPDEHLAGVLYLFVRGMTGPDVPCGADGSPFGVFAWRPPSSLVLDLSDLLDGSLQRGGGR